MRLMLCAAILGVTMVSGQAQAPSTKETVVKDGFTMQFVGIPEDGQLRMKDVIFRFSDGTELSADELLARETATTESMREVKLRGTVRLRFKQATSFVPAR